MASKRIKPESAAEEYAELRDLFRHHIESFDYLIENGLQTMFEHIRPVEIHNPHKNKKMKNILFFVCLGGWYIFEVFSWFLKLWSLDEFERTVVCVIWRSIYFFFKCFLVFWSSEVLRNLNEQWLTWLVGWLVWCDFYLWLICHRLSKLEYLGLSFFFGK